MKLGQRLCPAAFFGLAVLGCARDSDPVRAPRALRSDPGGAELVVMTYNVNYGIEGDPDTIRVVAESNADVVLLQETTPSWEKSFAQNAAVNARYPHSAFHAPVRWAPGGIGVLSRYPIETDELIASPVDFFPAQRVVVKTPIGRVQALNVHLHPNLLPDHNIVVALLTTPKVRKTELEAFLPKLDPTLPSVIAGDFNEAEAGSALGELRDDGWESALYEFAPSATTWRWPWHGLTLHARFDHVVFRPGCIRASGARVIQGGNSDHLAVVARLRIGSDAARDASKIAPCASASASR